MLSLDDDSEATLSLASSDARIVGKHYEYDSVSNTQTKRYYANGTLLATRTGTTLTYVQGDHLGSSSTLTNSSGVVVSKERYAAFGERRRTSDKVLTDQLYTGQRLNVLSGLYHYSDGTSAGRFYDPLLGRFVMADPVTPPASVGLNRYAYANNSPIRYNDPNGQMSIDMADGSGIGAGAMWAIGIGGGHALRAWVISQIANAVPAATANVDKVPGILQAVQQNGENAQRAAQSSNSGEASSSGDPGSLDPQKLQSVLDKGKWVSVNEHMSESARQYQEYVTGRSATEAFKLNGVKFEGLRGNALLDAKDRYSQFVDAGTGKFQPWFKGSDEMVTRAESQLKAAQGIRIEWHFSQEATANAVRQLFVEKGVTGINIIYDPMP